MNAPGPSPLPEGFGAFLEARRVEYGLTLPRRIAEVRKLWSAVALEPAPAAHLAELNRVVHSLAGSAGTFGFPEAGARAEALQAALTPLQEGAGFVGREERRAIDAAVAALERCVVR